MQLPKRKPGKYDPSDIDLVISEEKLTELKTKLAVLKKKSPQASKEVARLAELGDFSENVEYQLAKRRLRGINSGILKLEYQIDHAKVIDSKNNNTIQIGNTVIINVDEKEKKYKILGSTETNPEKGIISYTSPLGSSLIGHKTGDKFKTKIAGRDVPCEIISIE